jgi:hypothetical protein
MNDASSDPMKTIALAGLVTPTGDHHFCALFGEGDGGGAPDAGQPAGD